VTDLRSSSTVERFRRWGIVAWTIIGILLLSGAGLGALLMIREIFPPLVVAVVTIYVLNPLVTRLEGFGLRRLFGGCLSYLVLLAAVSVGISLLIPVLVDQGEAFAKDFPNTIDRVADMAESVERRFNVEINVDQWIGADSEFAREGLKQVGHFLGVAAETLALIVVGLVVGFYLLVDLPQLRTKTLKLFPPDRRGEWRTVAHDVGSAMGGFFRGQLFVALIVAVMSSLGLALIGLPYWAVVGVIAGLFNLVPLIGPFVGAVPAIIIALALKTPTTALLVVVVLTVVQQIDNHFISPNVMRWSVKLHPVTVMFTLIAGAALAGFFGLLVAVPVVASIKVVVAHLWRTRVPWGEEVFDEPTIERGPPHLEAEEEEDDTGGGPPAVLPGT
jgi:predicted PurR-regulated permease PerM